MLNRSKQIFASSAMALALAACTSTPEQSQQLTSLESQYQAMAQKGFVEQYAPIALQEAKEAINSLEQAEQSGADEAIIAQRRYLAEKKLNTAMEQANYNQAEEVISNADVRRKEAQLAAKEQQADAARAEAQAMRARANMAEQEAAQAKARVDSIESRASKLSEKLANITAEETDRGLVLTMGSILFELDEATLKPGAEDTLQRVSRLLGEYPERQVLVEGYTDSTGSQAYNQKLSRQRAESVAETLAQNGVDSSRVATRGYGESYPVASNNSDAGRQQNRRVELVIAKSGDNNVAFRD